MTARPANGFTLPEVMVSLFLFGLIAALLLAVLDMEHRADATVRHRNDTGAAIAATQDLLRGRIEALRPVPDLHGAGNALLADGETTRFAFDAPPLAAVGPHALQHYRIDLSPNGQLAISWASSLSGLDPRLDEKTGWTRLVLLDRVRSIRFSYFGRDPMSGHDAWQDRWIGRGELPELVRLDLAFADGDTRIWPMLIVRPWARVRPACPPDTTGKTATDTPCGDAS